MEEEKDVESIEIPRKPEAKEPKKHSPTMTREYETGKSLNIRKKRVFILESEKTFLWGGKKKSKLKEKSEVE